MLNEKLLNRRLLNEVSVDTENRIKTAINNVLRVMITYNDGKLPRKGRNIRYILPVAFGVTKSGKKAVRAYQTSGSTKRGAPKWKLFLLDNIVTWNNGKRTFKEYKDDLIRLGLNLEGDKHMTKLFAITPFANNNVQISKYDNTIDPEPILKTDIEPTIKNQKPSNSYKKTQPNINKTSSTIDINKEKDYYQNKTDYPTKPISKVNVGNSSDTQSQDKNTTTNINNGDITPVDNKPITKGEIENDISNNVLTNTYNDMMNRMDNLNNDNNEDNLEYGNQ